MSVRNRVHYYQRIAAAYLGGGRSQLSFWHEVPERNPRAITTKLGEYYMLFREKADYGGPFDGAGIPMLNYHGRIGLQYNPIAIAQWGLANYNRFCETSDDARLQKTLKSADWLVSNLQKNPNGLSVWNHHFDWEYRDTLRAPWYSGLAQGQGVSLLLRAHAQTGSGNYMQAAQDASVPLTKPIDQGGVLFEDENDLWIEEYLVTPPTHILNGFIWALWGAFDFWLATADPSARNIFVRGVETLLRNLARFDTGYWSLYEQSGTRVKMLASPFYHRLHVVQLRVMADLTGDPSFSNVADRWEAYTHHRTNRARALVEKGIFKLLYY